jgi:voltage-gated sodium channel type X alpha
MHPWGPLLAEVLTDLWYNRYVGAAIDIRGISGLRTFRVLRALKTVSVIPGERL